MSGWNLASRLGVAAVMGAMLVLHLAGAVAAETGKANIMQSLTEADNDRTVELRVGDGVRLSLPENATTGYRWAVDRFDRDVVEPVGSEPHYAGGAVGSAGRVTFDFTVKKAGRGEIALKYWRHFEGEKSIVRRFRVDINAQP